MIKWITIKCQMKSMLNNRKFKVHLISSMINIICLQHMTTRKMSKNNMTMFNKCTQLFATNISKFDDITRGLMS